MKQDDPALKLSKEKRVSIAAAAAKLREPERKKRRAEMAEKRAAELKAAEEAKAAQEAKQDATQE